MRSALVVLTVLAALVGVAVLGLAFGALLAPTSSLFAIVGSMVWAPFGPFLLLAVLATFVVGVAARIGGLRRLGGAVLALSAFGIAASGFILARMTLAALGHGATIDLPATFRLGSMDRPSPAIVETVRSVEATQLRAAIASATYPTPQAPPTLIVLPERDSLVVARGTLAFVRDAEAAGLDLELVRIPFANHVFNQIAANSLGNQIGHTVRLRFLERHVR